jgi:uncharacterized protein (TIGR02444 family)
VTIYGAPGVEAACLDLQDRFGADVNMALYCLWIGRVLTPESLDAAMETADAVQSYVRPLREMRRTLPKDADGGVREAVKKAELAAEKLEQDALEALGQAGTPDRAAAAVNLGAYAMLLGADQGAFLAAAMPLLDAC